MLKSDERLTVDHEAADLPPWLHDDEVAWHPRTRCFALCAVEHQTADCMADLGVPNTTRVVEVPAPQPGFENLAGVDAVFAVLPFTEAVANRHRSVIDLLTAAGHREQIGRLVPISEAAALGTTRRISRESHTSALWIDEAARLLIELAGELGGPGGLVLDVVAVDTWDRPSLRVLFRAAVLADSPHSPLWIRGRLRHCTPSSDVIDGDQVGQMRKRFLEAIARRSQTVVHLATERDCPARCNEFTALDDLVGRANAQGLHVLLRLIGDSLALQNFERARLLVDSALRALADDDIDRTVQLYRLAAITSAQVGDIDLANRQLLAAVRMARRPEDLAHLNYLLGLISTKRTYDLDTARAYYRHAQRAVDQLAEPGAEALVEKAWAANGLALAAAMAGKGSSDAAQRGEYFARAYSLELSAFRLVRGQPGMSAFYLRYNLGYNLSFLLEITGRYRQAQEFLTSVSAVLLSAERSDFGALYKYAIGLLQLREQEYGVAATTLREAVELAVSLRDPFYMEKMLAALGYVEHRAGMHAAAASCYGEGLHLAKWLADEEAYRQHLAGLLWSIVLGELPYPDTVRRATENWFPSVAQAMAAGDRATAEASLLESAAELSVPSSKLPSYIAAVDLEGVPGRDLNRFLAGVAATESPSAGTVNAS